MTAGILTLASVPPMVNAAPRDVVGDDHADRAGLLGGLDLDGEVARAAIDHRDLAGQRVGRERLAAVGGRRRAVVGRRSAPVTPVGSSAAPNAAPCAT